MKDMEPDDFNKSKKFEKYLVLFYADWCAYCKKFKPIFESVDSKCNIFGSKINEDENPLWDKFSISTVPTIIAFEGNNIVARRDGQQGIGLVKADISSLLDALDW